MSIIRNNASFDAADTPVILLDHPSFAPSHPHINDARVSHVLDEISMHIVNIAGINSGKNAARMMLYNILSQHQWQNDLFDEVFKMSVARLLQLMPTSAATASSLAKAAVEYILSLYSSQLVMEQYELQELITPQALDSARTNAGYLHHFKEELGQVQQGYGNQNYGHQHHHGHQQQQPVQQNYQMVNGIDPQTGAPIQVLVPLGGHQGGHVQQRQQQLPPQGRVVQGFGGVRIVEANTQPGIGLARDYGMPEQNTRSTSNLRQVSNSRPDPGESFDDVFDGGSGRMTDLAGDIRQGRHVTHTRGYIDRDAPLAPEPDEQAQPTQHRQEQHVNRDKHTIAHGTGPKPAEEPVVVDRLALIEQEITEAAPMENLVFGCDIGTMIAELRMKHIASPQTSVLTSYVATPEYLISKQNFRERVKWWLREDDLVACAKDMANTLKRATSGEISEIADAEASLVREFDLIMTSRVNRFLIEKLNLDIDIDSFMDDYHELPGYLQSKIGVTAVKMLKVFEQYLIGLFRNDEIEGYLQSLGTAPDVEGIKPALVPVIYSVTVFPLDRVHLKIPDPKDKKLKKIRIRAQNSFIFRMMKNLFMQTDPDMPIENILIDRHLLVTRDGVIYRVNKALDDDELILVKI